MEISYDDAYLALVAIQRLLGAINSPESRVIAFVKRRMVTGESMKSNQDYPPRRVRESTSKSYQRFQVPAAAEANLSLEDLFTRRLQQLYVILRDQGGYSAKRFLTSVNKNGGVEHAKRSLRRQVELQAGFDMLRQLEMLDQSMEAHVINPQFQSLFTAAEIAEARRRLANPNLL